MGYYSEPESLALRDRNCLPTASLPPRCQRLFGGDQHVERLPRLGHVSDTGWKTDALAWMLRSEDHRKKRLAHLHLACQINAIHDAAKPDVREDHGNLTPADQHGCKLSFRACAFDSVQQLVFEQRPVRLRSSASSSTINTVRRFGVLAP
jgi:hypothetical protein